MKIGILTQPLNHNYGGIIQNYALQKVLKDAGMQVETINHHISPKKTVRERIMYILGIVKRYLNNSKKNYILTKKEKTIIERNISSFINKHMSLTDEVNSIEKIKELDRSRKYNAYVVGSDQCWRPRYNQGCLDCMYLSFVDRNVKKIAYAVSFGSDKWEYSLYQTKVCADWVKRFDFVSVREDSGIDLCKHYLGIDAKQVLDPTLLLKQEDYINLVEEEKEKPFTETLFNYILDPSPKKREFIKMVETNYSFESFQVLPKYYSVERTKDIVKNNLEDCVYPSLTSWLRAFMDAKMIIVDSFHGAVFSIIFNKPFWVIGNTKRGMSRFVSLLKTFGLQDRLIEESGLSIIDIYRPIDWMRVNKILNNKREESLYLLMNTLQNG